MHRGNHWGHADLHYICCSPYSSHSLDVASLTNLKNFFAAIFHVLDEVSVTPHFDRYACFRFHGDLLGSTNSRGDRSAFIPARWSSLGGSIDTSGSDLRPGVVEFFIKQNIQVNGQYVLCVVALVHWFQHHPSRYSLGAPVKVCADASLNQKVMQVSSLYRESMANSYQHMTLLQKKMFLSFFLSLASSSVKMVLFSFSHCHAIMINYYKLLLLS